ncbi:putative Peptidase A24A prepilin type IV [Desulfosarcina cetonica]|uniref:A24 family peptidase n=1 Tax=Desulfosarcina cetonica TaxID=90730 RepID=UPI0006D13D30|nr:prepilin peptidase [Desulfosarcina cetonica]VTR71434.1 putative Peptidase A24A prepilin type IV [Desulfosarcina cetonica]
MPIFTDQAVRLACFTVLLTASYTDLTRRIIPNALIVAGSLGGLAYHLLATASPVHGLVTAASGVLAGGLLLFLPYFFSWTGAGDVKLLAVLGAWLGPGAVILVFVYTTLVGGLMAAIVAVRHGRRLHRTRCPSGAATVWKRSELSSPGLPYALAMGGGYLLYLTWGNPF